MDRSYLYGDGLFETLRVEGEQVYFRDRHAARFERSAIALSYPESSIEAGLRAIHGVDAAKDGLHRVTVSRDDPRAPFGGDGGVQVTSRELPSSQRPRLTLMRGWYWPDDPIAAHKTTSYLRWVEARRRANAAGFDDAVLASRDGRVGETSTCNIFVVVGGEVVTPSLGGILPGVSRETILASQEEFGLAIEEREVTEDDLSVATEIVCTSAGCLAVAAESLDGRRLDDALAPRLRELLREVG